MKLQSSVFGCPSSPSPSARVIPGKSAAKTRLGNWPSLPGCLSLLVCEGTLVVGGCEALVLVVCGVVGGSVSASVLPTVVFIGKTAANSHVGNWPNLPIPHMLPEEEAASATRLVAVVLSVDGSGLVVVVGGSHCMGVFLYSMFAMSRTFCKRLSCKHSLLCSCVVKFGCAVVIVLVAVLSFPEQGTWCCLMLVLFLPLYFL